MESIKSIRESKRLSQVEVAKRLDIDTQNYHRLEKRGKKLSIEQLENIANALEVSVFEILGNTGFNQNEELSNLNFEIQKLKKENENLMQLNSVLGVLLSEFTNQIKNEVGTEKVSDFVSNIRAKYPNDKNK